ncbi:structural maintenance of chromosomes protein [Scheffersomyces stipitis CBS 6054]|uniref:Structural maintenance of chromosomes protein 5 n=1 Tax=Scheffersomyces stipitis (strain ATCC 58785 / CBS 6054 / NBRC 10063 / NRRL Y-11545) TaxID=322104 RepID=A3LQV2_PICST|nr:structural maintenance of chromosomes protein [Scheffersomyces stipitis CBS 6054]ABN65627.2 structural maintenance of chromosomes protein [Scheffersomyces stipitis CBS 6054]
MTDIYQAIGDLRQYVGPNDSESVAKRRKVQSSRDFRPGSLMKLKLTNFNNYGSGEFNLSPSLNMVIGPNGSGKSTVVSAICLGLGGKIDLIKRQTLSSMIKKGKSTASTEVTIKNFDGQPPILVKREFTAKENRWYINHRPATEAKVKELRARFNIQLDNLCHFLPQERVAEFAGMSQEKLLMETERTLGDGQLYRLHEDLIKNDTSRQDVTTRIEELEEKLSKFNEERSRLEADIKKLEEYEGKTLEIEQHTKIIPYAQLSDLKKQRADLKRERDKAKSKLSKFLSSMDPLKDQHKEIETKVEMEKGLYSDIDDKQKEIRSRFINRKADLSKIKEEIGGLKSTVESLKSKSIKLQNQLKKLEEKRHELISQRDLIVLPDKDEVEGYRKLRREVSEKKDEIGSKIEDLEDKIQEKQSSRKEIMNNKKRVEQSLNSKDRLMVLSPRGGPPNSLRDGAYNAHKFLRDEAQLKDHYFESPVVCCTVTNKTMAPHLEKVIDNNTLFSITTTNKQDFSMISSFQRKMKINFPIRLTTNSGTRNPRIPKERLKQWGFECYLSDFLSGPGPVVDMIYDISKIQDIPVSRSGLSEEQIERLTMLDGNGRYPFKKFISHDTLFVLTKSNYGSNQVSYTTEKVTGSRWFDSSGLTQEAKDFMNGQLQEFKDRYNVLKGEEDGYLVEKQSLDSESRKLSAELEKYKNKIQHFTNETKNRAKIEGKLTALDAQIKKTTKESTEDTSEQVDETEEKIKSKYLDYSNKLSELSIIGKESSDVAIELSLQSFRVLQIRNREIAARNLIAKVEEQQVSLRKEYERLKAEYDQIKKGDAVKKIEEQSASYTPEERVLLSRLAKAYMDAGNFSEQVIRDKISLLEDERSVMATADVSSIERLRRTLTEIDSLEKTLPRLKDDKSKLDKRISDIQEAWEPELTKAIRNISLAFNKRFSRVASDGQVELAKAERFKDWKLQILVKFRQESELKVLDHQSQSGGERAVTTIFFMMSLSGLTNSPFRVVDEINQGMDRKNEKMAHRYLVDTACHSLSSQYFLVTPKLLTGLYYHPEMAVHCIYSGPLVDGTDRGNKEPDFMDFKANSLAQKSIYT